MTFREVGQPCGYDASAGVFDHCLGSYCRDIDADTHVCTAFVADGGPCTFGLECQWGTQCSELTKTCVPWTPACE